VEVDLHVSHRDLTGPSAQITYIDAYMTPWLSSTTWLQPLAKLQFCQPSVDYLGYVLKDGCLHTLKTDNTNCALFEKEIKPQVMFLNFYFILKMYTETFF